MADLRSRQEAGMRLVASALVCLLALYTVDSIWFNGWYFLALNQMLDQVRLMGW